MTWKSIPIHTLLVQNSVNVRTSSKGLLTSSESILLSTSWMQLGQCDLIQRDAIYYNMQVCKHVQTKLIQNRLVVWTWELPHKVQNDFKKWGNSAVLWLSHHGLLRRLRWLLWGGRWGKCWRSHCDSRCWIFIFEVIFTIVAGYILATRDIQKRLQQMMRFLSMYLCICTSICASMYECMNVWMHECMNECMNEWMYACMHDSLCTHTCMHACIIVYVCVICMCECGSNI